MDREVKHCAVCGKVLEGMHINTLYCPECKIILRRKKQNAYKKRKWQEKKQAKEELQKQQAVRPKPKEKPKVSIEQLAIEARKAGMSYGQYVARRGIG